MSSIENITLLDVNKPDKVQKVINELVDKSNDIDLSSISKEGLGLENVDNTSDINKPVSVAQQTAIDTAKAECVKLVSETKQIIDSDIQFADGKRITLTRGDDTEQTAIDIVNNSGYETMNIGSQNVPLKLLHSQVDINDNTVQKAPKISIKDENGTITEDNLALASEVVNNNILANAETQNGLVSKVDGQYFTDVNTDAMGLHICVRNIKTGVLISDTVLPLKLASSISRGLMSKEQVAALSDVISRVAALEGKAARYLYTANTNPTATQINNFAVNDLGLVAPFTGISIVVARSFHVWNYYENDNIGWRDDGSDTVQKATNNSLGIVVGSDTTGKVYVEADGSMSVVGFDALSAKVSSLENSGITNILLESGTNNGTVKLTITANGQTSVFDNIAVKGLGTMAYQTASDYSTTTQMNSAISAAINSAISPLQTRISDLESRMDDVEENKLNRTMSSASAGNLLQVGQNGEVVAVESDAENDVVDVYIVDGVEPYTVNWLSETENGEPLVPAEGRIYVVRSIGDYHLQQFVWSSPSYIKISADGLEDKLEEEDFSEMTNDEIDNLF